MKSTPSALFKSVITAVTATVALIVLPVQTASAVLLYQDLPIANSNWISHHTVGGPVLADDFVPAATGAIEEATWWGNQATSDQWELTLHFDNNGQPAVNPAQTGGFKIFVTAVGVAIGNGIFQYTALFKDPFWFVQEGVRYWFSTANLNDNWTWAYSVPAPNPGQQAFLGVQSVGGTPCGDGGPHCGPWTPTDGSFAFRLTTPEPATLALTVLGLAGLAFSRRRQG